MSRLAVFIFTGWILAAPGFFSRAVGHPVPQGIIVRGNPRTLASSFEGEIGLRRSKHIFRYYAPAPENATNLDQKVVRKLAAHPNANAFLTNKGASHWKKSSKTSLSWSALSNEGKGAFLQELFTRAVKERLVLAFFEKYRASNFKMDPQQWSKLSRKERLEQVTYDNLNQSGRKRYKEILRGTFPLVRQSRTPRAFEEILFWETPNTYELRHHSKTNKLTEVAKSIAWMKKNIGEDVRPHQHISWKPDLSALTSRRKEFLSFVQRVDMLMFSQRLENASVGALYGSYGQNFMPYSASKLAEIDASLINRTYELLLGSKLHGLGLRTYRDRTIGLEIRAVTDPTQIKWFAKLISRALRKGAVGAIRYDEHPLEFAAIGARLQPAVRKQLGEHHGPPDLACWIDQELRRAGLDQRVSYPLLSWEKQSFLSAVKRPIIVSARNHFIQEVAQLLGRHAVAPLPPNELREAVMSAVWQFSSGCQLSHDLQHSLEAPLASRARGPALIAP